MFSAPGPAGAVTAPLFAAPAAAVDEPLTLFASPDGGPATVGPAPLLRRPGTPPAARGPAKAPPPPTPEQAAILDAYWRGEHVIVEALAGTGKTTSLRQLAAARPDRSGVYVAYNAAIAGEAAGKFPARVSTGTAHSFAYRAIGARYAHRLPRRRGAGDSQARRLPASDVAAILGLRDVRLGDRHLTDVALARLAEATVERFCRSADGELAAQHLPYTPGIETPQQVAELAALVVPAAVAMWADICNPDGRLWFTHDHYLKMWQLTGPRLPGDYVLFDEAQDANPVIAAIVAAQDHAQLIYVGDRNQQLYAWRGAVDAMSGFDGVRLPLTRSFRFGHAVAAEANEWLALLGTDLRLVGHDPVTSTLGPVDEPDAILCRSNGGAIGAVMAEQNAGRRVALVGDGVEVKRFAWAARSLMAGKGCDLPELAAFKTWRQLVEYVDEEHSGRDLAVLVKLVQRYGPGALIDTVDALTPAGRAQVVVSTAHRAKGLEWPRVRIGDDFAPPADGDRPEPAELMLAYVSVTRAQQRLDPGALSWRRTGRLDPAGRWISHDLEDL